MKGMLESHQGKGMGRRRWEGTGEGCPLRVGELAAVVLWVMGCTSLLVCLPQRPEQPVLSKDPWGMVLGKEPSLNPKDGREGGEALPFLLLGAE